MAVGAKIVSVYAGVPDPYSHVPEFKMSDEKTHKINYDDHTRKLFGLYAEVRQIRDSRSGFEALPQIEQVLKTEFPEDWLCSMEILELLKKQGLHHELQDSIQNRLQQLKEQKPSIAKLITDGLALLASAEKA